MAIFIKMIPTMVDEFWRFAKGNARCGNSGNRDKMLTEILMLTHALEKGFSLPNMRKSFGKEKASKLSVLIEKYISSYGYTADLIVPISLMKKYMEFHKENGINSKELDLISDRIQRITEKYKEICFDKAGSIDKTKEEMLTVAKGDFKTLATGRYSIRNFDKTPVAIESINEAIEIAKKSPSACNRQSYRVHVFEGENKNHILKLQGGANSFSECVDKVILITADLHRYYTREPHLGYVDGSLFAMSLMYALTYLGIGSIPLTLGIKTKNLKRIHTEFDIPENEIPVLLIAVGNYTDSFKVARSERNGITSFTTYHK